MDRSVIKVAIMSLFVVTAFMGFLALSVAFGGFE